MLQLRIEGDPVGWARPRFSNGRGYTAEKQRDAKADLQWFLTSAWRKDPIPRGVPIELDVTFVFKAKTKKEIGGFKTTKPDIDNLLKLILDAGNDILYWDDAQVVKQSCSKMYGENPETLISMKVINP